MNLPDEQLLVLKEGLRGYLLPPGGAPGANVDYRANLILLEAMISSREIEKPW